MLIDTVSCYFKPQDIRNYVTHPTSPNLTFCLKEKASVIIELVDGQVGSFGPESYSKPLWGAVSVAGGGGGGEGGVVGGGGSWDYLRHKLCDV